MDGSFWIKQRVDHLTIPLLSRPSSQVPHMREGEKLSYSSIQNPWTNAFDSLSARTQFQHAANELFSGFDIEALVASMQEPGYELAETDSSKGSPELFHLGFISRSSTADASSVTGTSILLSRS